MSLGKLRSFKEKKLPTPLNPLNSLISLKNHP